MIHFGGRATGSASISSVRSSSSSVDTRSISFLPLAVIVHRYRSIKGIVLRVRVFVIRHAKVL